LAGTNPEPKRLRIRKDKTNPRRIAQLGLILFAAPPDSVLLGAGALLVIASVVLHGWAAGYLARAGYSERETVLTVRGPYRHTRNPYYLAQLSMDLGFFFLAGMPFLYLLYFPVIFSVYRSWIMKEESFLEKEFGDEYDFLKRQVPRWRFQVRPAIARGSALTFNWKTFMLNRELPRSVSHLLLLAVFLLYWSFSNPFAYVPVLARATVLAIVAVWLVLHDIHPVDVSRKSVGWLLTAFMIGAATLFFLLNAPLWDVWPRPWTWLGIGIGFCLGLFVSATTAPDFYRVLGKTNEDVFAQPMCQWYAMGLALGLLTCTLGGVWLGMMVPLILWMLGIAGLTPLTMLPRRRGVAFALTFLIVTSAGTMLMRHVT